MPIVNKFPFEYIVRTPEENGTNQITIETPWIDENKELIDQMDRDYIYQDASLVVIEQTYPNGFHIILIEDGEKVILKSNWELDKMDNGKFLPRIQ